MFVRREAAGDAPAIAGVHASAFRQAPDAAGGELAEPAEVALVERLRGCDAWIPRLSIVALVDGSVVGHVVCSRAEVGPGRHPALGLGPIGVLPDHQRRGVGSALMHAVLAAAEALDEPLVALVGDPGYYRRFGFVPAADHGLEPPDPGWSEYFQVRTLTAYTTLRGRFGYAPPFDAL